MTEEKKSELDTELGSIISTYGLKGAILITDFGGEGIVSFMRGLTPGVVVAHLEQVKFTILANQSKYANYEEKH